MKRRRSQAFGHVVVRVSAWLWRMVVAWWRGWFLLDVAWRDDRKLFVRQTLVAAGYEHERCSFGRR
jgi:hypothetical protein